MIIFRLILTYITENGIREILKNGTVDDQARIKFMDDHIKELLRAKQDGVDVRGYYVWSSMDLYS